MGDEEACEINLAELTPSNYKCHFCAHGPEPNQGRDLAAPPPVFWGGRNWGAGATSTWHSRSKGACPGPCECLCVSAQDACAPCEHLHVCLHRTRVHRVNVSVCVCTGHVYNG